MAPRRDAFALALSALRHRLRQGVDAPGDALPINLIAADLRLSSTPVREALSRLAGEHLVEKRGPAYRRPPMDGPALAELYNLRWLYLSAALASDKERRVARYRAAPSEPLAFARELAQGASPVALIEALFLELMRATDDLILVQVFQPAADRLAPFASVEAQLFGDVAQEALSLVTAFETGQAGALRVAVRHFHRRRIGQAHAIARLAESEKYRSDIV